MKQLISIIIALSLTLGSIAVPQVNARLKFDDEALIQTIQDELKKRRAERTQLRQSFRKRYRTCRREATPIERRSCRKAIRDELTQGIQDLVKKNRRSTLKINQKEETPDSESQEVVSQLEIPQGGENQIDDSQSEETPVDENQTDEASDETQTEKDKNLTVILESIPYGTDEHITRSNQFLARVKIINPTDKPITLLSFKFICAGSHASSRAVTDNKISFIVVGEKEIPQFTRHDEHDKNCQDPVTVRLDSPVKVEPHNRSKELWIHYNTSGNRGDNRSFQLVFPVDGFQFVNSINERMKTTSVKTNSSTGDLDNLYGRLLTR